MNSLVKVYDPTLLNPNKVYQVDGCLYRFLRKDPYSSIEHPKYCFKPLPRQRKQSNLDLNKRQLLAKCYEVPGMQAVSTETETTKSVQMELF